MLSQLELDKIQLAESVIGYTFEDKNLFWEALSAPGSSCIIWGALKPRGHVPLAGIGDAVAKAILHEYCYDTGITAPGDVNYAWMELQCDNNLARIFDAKCLEKCVNRNPSQVGFSMKTKATTVEAIVGATFKDGGYEAARRVAKGLGIVVKQDDGQVS